MAADHHSGNPSAARASGLGWWAWLTSLSRHGRDRLAALGLAFCLATGLAAAALWGFADLAEDVASRETEGVDAVLRTWVAPVHAPALDWAALVLSLFGSELVYVLVAVVVILLGRRQRWGAAAGLILATGGAALLNVALKLVFQRARPEAAGALFPAAGYSFPSGHAMAAAACYFFLAYLAWRLARGWLRWVYAGALCGLALGVGWARIYLGLHYPTDVAAGFLAGFVWADAVVLGGYLLARGGAPCRVAAT
jgi:undecaprenyl-diphosphatase